MMNNKIDFNKKTILITGGAGFIGSNLAFYFQENFPKSKVIVFDCFRNDETFNNGNLKSFGHYKNLIGFKGDIICGNINNQNDLYKSLVSTWPQNIGLVLVTHDETIARKWAHRNISL